MSFGGLSATCVSNLTTVLSTPPLSTCTASSSLLSSFFPVLIGGGNASSLVQPLNSYLGAVCPAPLCSNQTILTGLNSINSACGDVLGDFGLTNMTIATYVPILPAIKGVLCTQQVNSTAPASANNTEYCVTETLSTVETLIGRPITASFLLSILRNPAAITQVFNTTLLGNSSAICTDCTKALYTGVIDIVNSTLIRDAAALSNTTQSSVASTLMRAVAGVCGPSFVNGTRPTSIRNGTNTNPSATASASARPSTGAATSVSSSSYAVSALALAGMAGALLI